MKPYKDIIAIIYEHGYKSLAMNLDKPEYEEDTTILGTVNLLAKKLIECDKPNLIINIGKLD